MRIDLHRHLGGSIKPSVVWEIIKSQDNTSNLVNSLEAVERDMTYKHDNEINRSFNNFLKKFNLLNYIRWNEARISRVIQSVIQDLKEEGIKYCELRFSINKYLNHLPWDETEATLFVLNQIKKWSKEYNVRIGPILCLKYETPKVYSKRISKLIHKWKIAEDVAGIDVVGAETFFDKNFLKDCFRYWRLCDKGLLIHAGETQTAENVRTAIEDLHVNRIAHGVTAADKEHDEILSIARYNNVAFDVALTSNFITGVTERTEDDSYHPVIKMLMKGCNITIGTDDPAIFDVTLDDEYQLLERILKKHSELADEEIKTTVEEIKINSHSYALNIGKLRYEEWDH